MFFVLLGILYSAMVTNFSVFMSVSLLLCSLYAVSEAGVLLNQTESNITEVEPVRRWNILPKFEMPSFKLPTFKLPTFKLPTFKLPTFNTLWTEIPKQASSNLIPHPIKQLFNFDPVPGWVPHPKDFKDDDPEEEMMSDESARSFKDTPEQDYIEEDVRSTVEQGNLHGFGREVLRSLSNQFSTGLDTDLNFLGILNLNAFKDKIKAIVPGTQWCGDGNIARTKKHLGFFYKTDSCCRDHDNCPDFLEKDESKHGIKNRGLFTRSNCECDNKFYECLKEAHDMIANQIGMAYFSVLGPQCFKEEYPVVDCRIRVGLTQRCIEYNYDNSTEKIYQWFDNPEY